MQFTRADRVPVLDVRVVVGLYEAGIPSFAAGE